MKETESATHSPPSLPLEESGSPALPTSPATGSTRRLPYSLLVLLLIVLGAGNAAWLWREKNTLEEFRSGQLRDQRRHTDSNMKEFNQIKRELGALTDQQIELEQRLAERVLDPIRQNTQWALAEIEYLLIIAQHRLLLETDPKRALRAMELANARLQHLDGNGLDEVREQFELDLNALREAAERTGFQGLGRQLFRLGQSFGHLPLRSPTREQKATEPAADELASAEPYPLWKKASLWLWREFSGLLRVYPQNAGAAQSSMPLVIREHAYRLARLELESARLALLYQDRVNFLSSLEVLDELLREHYDLEDSSVNATRALLEKMKATELEPELPQLSSSLESLRFYRRTLDEHKWD